MNPIDVIDERISRKQSRDPEGTIVQAYVTSVRVQPRGSTRTIMCDCTNVDYSLVGKRCTYSKPYGSKKYVVTAIFDTPKQTDLNNKDAGTSQNNHTLHDNIGGEIHRIIEKIILNDNDEVLINDSEDSWRPKRVKKSAFSGSGTGGYSEPVCFDGEILFFSGDVVMVGVTI